MGTETLFVGANPDIVKSLKVDDGVKNIYFIDLFCGAGGTSTGINMAKDKQGRHRAKVIACVNHDPNAIMSHEANHPDTLHFIEDIRTLELSPLVDLVNRIRKEDPGCEIHLWASLECTNFSGAKGGLPRDADSRTLAEHLFRYIDAIDFDHIWIENVREFLIWGPLNDNGKPIKEKKGIDFTRWVKNVQKRGFHYDHRILNAADYGAYTKRKRLFIQFSKNSDIRWPHQTHSKAPKKEGLFAALKKWKPVREVLDLHDHGVSIFGRKKPLVENTLKRIYAGLVKFVGDGTEDFLISNYSSADPSHMVKSLDDPSPTLTTRPHEHVVQPVFVSTSYSSSTRQRNGKLCEPCPTVTTSPNLQPVFIAAAYGGNTEQRVHGLDEACPTITTQPRLTPVLIQFNGGSRVQPVFSSNDPSGTLATKDRFGVVHFIANSYSGGGQTSNMEEPSPTLTTVPKSNKVTAVRFISNQYGTTHNTSIDDPNGSLTANPKSNKVTAYLVNPQYSSKGGNVDEPCFTLIARMDKMPPYLVSTDGKQGFICIYEDDNETMVKIKLFMAHYGISDIRMRMLNIREMLRIQGFPSDYILKGTKTEKKKYIGNSVECNNARALVESYFR